jgi:hypothetical protein
MMQGWMGEHPQQPGAARDSAAGDHANAHAEAQASAANAHASRGERIIRYSNIIRILEAEY